MSMENGTIYNPFLIDSWEGYPLLLLRFHNHTLFIFLIGNAFFFPPLESSDPFVLLSKH